ncbi:MAG: 4-methyl-5(B-hydroxyethyl)-thiazole monophosphate biosynthesis protein [Treponema sp. GWB1_62_6]|nr:MAG: 4-methyl-5(B-hydroxyethyl)-thiazole monophosphate biosynthesis protein [Treponema sp. GWB1_62_6]HCM28080.1 DJ-1 family protein [Treponema sp.]
MPKRAIVLLAEGFEDVEAVTPVDWLRRVGVEVVVASVSSSAKAVGLEGRIVKSARGLSILADASVSDLAASSRFWSAAHWDAVVIPGGMPGASNIASSAACISLIKEAASTGKIVAAICAAPAVVLGPFGLLEGRKFTCFPGMEKEVSGAIWSDQRVVVDGNFITSRAAGTAGEWARAIAAALFGEEAAAKLTNSVLLK